MMTTPDDFELEADEAPAKHPILLVDDEAEILFSLRGLLRTEFELYTAEGGPRRWRSSAATRSTP